VSYEHPLAYLIGLEGIALLRAFTGEHDREFVHKRLAEIRSLLDDPALKDAGVSVEHVDTATGYGIWSSTYDAPGNAAFDIDTPVLASFLEGLPVGDALDAACGTGRLSRLLTTRGHRVIAVDSSPDMLARASGPAEFCQGDLHALPVADSSVDVVVCGLALTHLPDLAPAFAEFARVLRPGGHLLISDVHPEGVLRASIPTLRSAGAPARLVSHRHLMGDYLRAALAVGLELRRCEEPVLPLPAGEPAPRELGPWELWPWALTPLVPDAARAANEGIPAMVIWDFVLRASRAQRDRDA
jgi:SAM-dependent methyltransferase